MSEVITHRVRGQFDPGLDLMTTQEVVLARDYAALEAERERLRGTMMEVVTKNFAKNLGRAAKDKELDYYLSEGIRRLQAERDALRQQRDKLAKVLEDVEREHDLIRRMKNCEIIRGRGSFGIAVMSDTHAIEWQALDNELQQLIDARRTALSELTP